MHVLMFIDYFSHVTGIKFVSCFCRHRNVNVRKTCAQYIMNLSERLGAARCLNGSKELTERILVAAAEFVSDGGALTR